MKKVIYLSAIAIVSVFIFNACGREDLKKPFVSIVSPFEGGHVEPGGKIELIASMMDDTELGSYKIEIHDAFDGHTHSQDLPGMQKSIAHEGETEDFSFSQTYTDAEGKDFHHISLNIDIPENATEGEYHLTVHVLDKAGNEAHATREFVIQHSGEELF